MYTQKEADKEYNDFVQRIETAKKMAIELEPAHEDNVTFYRLDMKKLTSTLFTDSESIAKKDNIRLSWTGMILATCPYPHFDDWMEEKKKRMTPGRIFLFNPDTAYSLNIEGMYEIWTLSLQNVMNFRNDLNVYELYKKSLQKRVEIFTK